MPFLEKASFSNMAALHFGTPYSIASALRALPVERRRTPLNTRCRRAFHEYFVTHLPSSSLSPDRSPKLPRNESQPHQGSHRSAAQIQHNAPRDTTIVRIPIRSAKHHFGASVSRGDRPYNEDQHQAGTIEIPAFAKRQPASVRRISPQDEGARQAESESGDPQVFYFGVFDGHGGAECSEFLRDRLHGYVEEAAVLFGTESSLQKKAAGERSDFEGAVMGAQDAEELQKTLVSTWKETVGGYFRRFKPEHFPAVAAQASSGDERSTGNHSSIETVLSYAFLKADLDFTTAHAAKHSEPDSSGKAAPADDPVLSDRPASQNLHQGRPSSSPDLNAPIGGRTRFKGGSTASVALISTPTPTPFWHPASPSTLLAAHVGDTRILVCRVSDGKAVPLTTNHHPSAPVEARRLRRYAASFVTDSFGEERVLGLANTRAFGDIGSKRVGVSAEPQISRLELSAAQYSFVVLTSDGVSGHLDDQEVVDIVKEAKTPAEASQKLIEFAVETGGDDADNATALVVRLGGWERRSEGGVGSMGTKEKRQFKIDEALDPRRGRR